MTEPRVFISFAQDDEALARAVKAVLLKGGVPNRLIDFTAARSTGVPTGTGFKEYIRERLDRSRMVIQVITPSYFWSQFCLAEMGAQWALGRDAFPMRVPSVGDGDLGFIGDVHVPDISERSTWWELFNRLRGVDLGLDETTWSDALDEFMDERDRLLDAVAPTPAVPSGDHERLMAERVEGVTAQRDLAADAINRMSLAPEVDFAEHVRYGYFVGADGDPDVVKVAFDTEARGRRVWFRAFGMGATGEEGSDRAPGSFEEANFRVLDLDADFSASFLPLVEGPGLRRLRGAMVFSPAVLPGSKVKWGYQLEWPGMWDQLRKTRRDDHLMIIRPERVLSMEVTFHFPWPVEVRGPDFGEVKRADERSYAWFATNPSPGEHDFRMERG